MSAYVCALAAHSLQAEAGQHLKLIKRKSSQCHGCNLSPILTLRGSFINLFAPLLPSLVSIPTLAARRDVIAK